MTLSMAPFEPAHSNKKEEITMKTKISRLMTGVALLAALTMGLNACAQKTTTGELYQRVPAKAHIEQFPEGHQGGQGHFCHYDEEGDVYFCSY